MNVRQCISFNTFWVLHKKWIFSFKKAYSPLHKGQHGVVLWGLDSQCGAAPARWQPVEVSPPSKPRLMGYIDDPRLSFLKTGSKNQSSSREGPFKPESTNTQALVASLFYVAVIRSPTFINFWWPDLMARLFFLISLSHWSFGNKDFKFSNNCYWHIWLADCSFDFKVFFVLMISTVTRLNCQWIYCIQ